jgi:hypothetical protein
MIKTMVPPEAAKGFRRAMKSKSNAHIRVREASLDDHRHITELESRYGLETNTEEEWKHLWVNNPVYKHLAESWPIGWVLQNPDQGIVGYLGNIPLSYQLESRNLVVASSRSWVVDSKYRSYSLLLLDYFFGQRNVDLYLTTSLNNQAFEGFQSFGPSPVPVGDWNHSRFWITNYVGFLASSLRSKRIRFAKSLSYPLALLPFFRDQLSRRNIGKKGKQGEIQFCSVFDERFDTFWEELKARRTQVLLGSRTREVLDWHFRYGLLRSEVWILCAWKGSRLLAYSIFYRQDTKKFGLKRLRLADFQTLESDELLLLPMLSCALKRCREEGIHMLEILGVGPGKARIIARLAPYRRQLSSWLSFYKTNDPELVESLKDPNRWDLSCFDGDISL